MLRRLIVTAALAASTLAVPAAISAAPAGAATAHAASAQTAASCYRRDGNVWRCITPGAFCPAAAHGRYGYAKVTNRRYKCKSSSPRWRWLR